MECLEDRRFLAVTSDTLAAELGGSAANDGVIVVTTLDDETDVTNGLTSLREAIFAANIVGGPNTIQFSESLYAEGPATILLTLGELKITDSLTINGPGAEYLTIDAAGNDLNADIFGDGSRIFNVDDATPAVRDVTIRGMTLTGGDSNQSGGAIFSREKLLAEQLVITENWATLGGAIGLFANGGDSVIADNTIVNNSAASQGGALHIQTTTGNVTIRGNTISHNNSNRGGAIYAGSGTPNGTLVIASNTISGNLASQQGGAIYIAPQAPRVTIRDSAISGNTAAQQGGGIFASSARSFSIINSQIVENRSTSESHSLGRGGGVYAIASDLSITGSTISGNSALSGGGTYSRGGELSISFSTISDNKANRGNGGGVFSNNDRFTLFGSTISGNVATGEGSGGGIWHAPNLTGLSSLADSTLSGNSAALSGGGVYFRATQEGSVSTVFTLTNLIVTGNSAGGGGGIATGSSSPSIVSGVLNVVDGEISNNVATLSGGGIASRLANLSVNGTTISGNRAARDGGGIAGPANGLQTASIHVVGALIADNLAGATTAPFANGEGGGLWIGQATNLVSISDTRFERNTARSGGAVFRRSLGTQGSLLLTGSSITGNVAVNRGGGLYNQGGLVSLASSVVDANSVTNDGGSGGGIHNRQADLLISRSSISGNSAVLSRAGGIYHSGGDLSVSTTTIAGNLAINDAGVAASTDNFSDRITFHSSTISSNRATRGIAGMTLHGDVTLQHTTITANHSEIMAIAAGLQVSGSLDATHSIIAGNTALSGTPSDLFSPGVSSTNLRYSLIGNGTSRGAWFNEAPIGSPDANGNLIGLLVQNGGQGAIDPLLGPLADNGGPTMTHALLPGSPALDAGALVTSAPQGYDQRGNPFSRMVDGTGDGVIRIDMGAYESQGVPNFTAGDFNLDGRVDAADYTVLRDRMGKFAAQGDGAAVQDDYKIWKSHFGQGLTFSLYVPRGGAAVSLSNDSDLEPRLPLPLRLVSPRDSQTLGDTPITQRLNTAAVAQDDGLLAWLAASRPSKEREAFPDAGSTSDGNSPPDHEPSFDDALEFVFAEL